MFNLSVYGIDNINTIKNDAKLIYKDKELLCLKWGVEQQQIGKEKPIAPLGLKIANNYLYVFDYTNQKIFKIQMDGKVVDLIYCEKEKVVKLLDVDAEGNIYLLGRTPTGKNTWRPLVIVDNKKNIKKMDVIRGFVDVKIKNNYIIDSVSDKKYRLKANEISSNDNVKLLIPNKDYIVDYSNNRIRILYSNEKEQHGMSFDKTRELNLISTDKNDILSDVDILGIDNNGNVYVLSGLRNSNRNKYFADIFQVTVLIK